MSLEVGVGCKSVLWVSWRILVFITEANKVEWVSSKGLKGLRICTRGCDKLVPVVPFNSLI